MARLAVGLTVALAFAAGVTDFGRDVTWYGVIVILTVLACLDRYTESRGKPYE